MTEIDGVTFADLVNRWKEFKSKRNKIGDVFDNTHPSFITVFGREKIIQDMIKHYHFLESEYVNMQVRMTNE